MAQFEYINLITLLVTLAVASATEFQDRPCSFLLMGQYKCQPPQIDNFTQQASNCTRENLVLVPCMPARGVKCNNMTFNGSTIGFWRNETCKWTNGHQYSTSLLLSIFLGFFGVDRFYLGYPVWGVLKLCTGGFMLFGYVIDMLLILAQRLGPADGSAYIVDYFSQFTTLVFAYNNNTYNHTYN